MVCDRCAKKQAPLVVPDKWREGSRTVDHLAAPKRSKAHTGSSVSSESKDDLAGRDVGGNRILLGNKRARVTGSGSSSKCRLCGGQLLAGHHYCHHCAYKRGICSMCGRKLLDTSGYRQTNK
jgi:hypothetical protein